MLAFCGMNLTVSVQLVATASVAGHGLLRRYTGDPLRAMLDIPAAAMPGFAIVTVSDAGLPPAFTLPKFSAVGLTETSVPMPVRLIVFTGAEVKFREIVPVRVPPATGENVT